MAEHFTPIKPQFLPPLDDQFCPAVLANRQFENAVAVAGVPLIFGLERKNGKLSRFETRVFPGDHPLADNNLYYAERMLKFLLWQRGGITIYIAGPHPIGEYLHKCYSAGGSRSFDYHFMREQVYESDFRIEPCEPAQIPPEHDAG